MDGKAQRAPKTNKQTNKKQAGLFFSLVRAFSYVVLTQQGSHLPLFQVST
jgi:hypothetical protein